jgi:hypothetical protein
MHFVKKIKKGVARSYLSFAPNKTLISGYRASNVLAEKCTQSSKLQQKKKN